MGKETEFLEACKEGNVIKVEHLLASLKNKKYIVPLFSKSVSALIQSKDARGSTPLHLASLNGRKAVVYLLLDEGADVNAADENGCLSLHLACWNGRFDIASALISHDPRQETINALTKNLETPLHFAAQYGHNGIVSLLLRNGANSMLRNNKGETPLDLAAKFGRVEVVRCLLDSNPQLVLNAMVTDPKQGDTQIPPPFSPLHLAAKNGKTEVVRLLLDAGFDVQFSTEEGTALHVAALHGKIDVVKVLLERGINADARDFHGRTALQLLEEHQMEKPVLLSHLLPNRDAWQHCSSVISEHLEDSSNASTASKEVAAIYVNAIKRQSQHQQQEREQKMESSSSPKTEPNNAIWLPLPPTSQERINFEQGVERHSTKSMETGKKVNQPLSVLTHFQIPPPPPSTECDSICSTISLTATPTASPAGLTTITTSSISSASPRFPLQNALTVVNKECGNSAVRGTPKVEGSMCTYQSVPLHYDNVPGPGPFPQTTYDNVPTNAVGYDNAPPPNVHAWSHTCCETNGQDGNLDRESAANVETPPASKTNQETQLVERMSPVRLSDFCAKQQEERRTLSRNAVKFVEAPPETLYLPVESKLYTRMVQPITLNSDDDGKVVVNQSTIASVPEVVEDKVVYGPYDNVPLSIPGPMHSQKKSPDFGSSGSDNDLTSLKIIEQTIQVIEQSSRDMEENVEAIVRSPSRSSQRSMNGSTASPSSPTKTATKKKTPPPVSPKPKFLLIPTIAPLAQPELDEMTTSTSSAEGKTGLSPITLSDNKPTQRRSHHRSVSGQRWSREGGPSTDGPSSPFCVDSAAQVDAAVGSEGSVCSCSGCSQCSLVNSTTGSIANGGNAVGVEDEQAEWNKIDAIFKSCGTRMARLSVLDSELEPSLSNYLNGAGPAVSSHLEQQPCNTVTKVEEWLRGIDMETYKDHLMGNGFDRIEFMNTTLDEKTLHFIGIDNLDDIKTILDALPGLPRSNARPAGTYRYVSDWLQAHGCQDYLGRLVRNGLDAMCKVLHLEKTDLERVLGRDVPLGHRLRLAGSLVGDIDCAIEFNNQSAVQPLRPASFPPVESIEERGPIVSNGTTTFSAHYLGSTLIEDGSGMEAARLSIAKLKKSSKEITKVPQVGLEISSSGVTVYDSASRQLLCEHVVENINCVCQDERDMNCFAYITKDGTRHFCHVFCVLTADIATDLILTLGKAFDVAYEKALRTVSL